MSRHRNIARLSHCDDYDMDDDPAMSPDVASSPSLAQYLFPRQGSTFGSFFPPAQKPHGNDDDDDGDGDPKLSVAIPTPRAQPTASPRFAVPKGRACTVVLPPAPAPAPKLPGTPTAGRGVTVTIKTPAPGTPTAVPKTPTQSALRASLASISSFDSDARAAPRDVEPPPTTPPDKRSGPSTDDGLDADMPRVASGERLASGDVTPRSVDGKRSKLSRQIEKEVEQARLAGPSKATLSLVVVGHVDAGKSTLMGHLLFKLGAVSEQVIHKFERDSARAGKKSFMYAWVLDSHEEERARGVTMDVAVTHFETATKRVTLLDAPGHRDFIPNMISGAAQADAAILVVSAMRGEFEAGFDAAGQTKEHALLLRSLGVKQLIVAINKLDTVEWEQARYDELLGKLRPFLAQVGFRDPVFVPVSGMAGENLRVRHEALLSAWYTQGTLMDAIDTLVPGEREVDGPLRLSISDVFKGQTGGHSVAGRIETGTVLLDERVMLLPSRDICTVKGIDRADGPARWAEAGENVTVTITGVEAQSLTGARILCNPQRPVRVVSKLGAQVLVMEGAMPIVRGAQVVLHCQGFSEAAHLSKLVSVRQKGGEVTKKKPRRLAGGETAEVEITTDRPVCLELYSECKALGRVMLREGGKTVAVGIVTQLL